MNCCGNIETIEEMKKASKYQAVSSIILSLLFMLFVVVGGYLYLLHPPYWSRTLAYGFGAALVIGILLLLYSLVLLRIVLYKKAASYLQLFIELMMVIMIVANSEDEGWIGFLVLGFLTSLAICGIHCANC